jgi:sec-independent protein translocase protein TatB
MFDIGFWELSLIGVVALLVIGPERLPGVARTAGLWFGRISRFVSDIKVDIDKELKADELKKVLEQQANTSGIHEMVDEGKSTAEAIEEMQEGWKRDYAAANAQAQEVATTSVTETVPVETSNTSTDTGEKSA